MLRFIFPFAEHEPQLDLLSLRAILSMSGVPSLFTKPCRRASSMVRVARALRASFFIALRAMGSDGRRIGVRSAAFFSILRSMVWIFPSDCLRKSSPAANGINHGIVTRIRRSAPTLMERRRIPRLRIRLISPSPGCRIIFSFMGQK